MADPRFSIIVPTHNHGALLRYSVESALRQTVVEIEIFIVGDGPTEETRREAEALAARDSRIRFFPFEKGPRLGEQYRHRLLLDEARGEFVAYLCDDDLWLPHHLATLAAALERHDFAHTAALVLRPDGSMFMYAGDLQRTECVAWMLENNNFIPLSSSAHRLDFYRRLPYGWRTTPLGIPTDLYMFQQFLREGAARAYSSLEITVLNFPSPFRRARSPDERVAELETWARRITNPAEISAFREQARLAVRQQLFEFDVELRRRRSDQQAAADRETALGSEAERLRGETRTLAEQVERLTAAAGQLNAEREHALLDLAEQRADSVRLLADLERERAERKAWHDRAAEYRRVLGALEQARGRPLPPWVKALLPR